MKERSRSGFNTRLEVNFEGVRKITHRSQYQFFCKEYWYSLWVHLQGNTAHWSLFSQWVWSKEVQRVRGAWKRVGWQVITSTLVWDSWQLCEVIRWIFWIILVSPATASNLGPRGPVVFFGLCTQDFGFWFGKPLKVILGQVRGLCACILRKHLEPFLRSSRDVILWLGFNVIVIYMRVPLTMETQAVT